MKIIYKSIGFEVSCSADAPPIRVEIVNEGAGDFYRLTETEPHSSGVNGVHLEFEEIEAIYLKLKKERKNEAL